MKIIYSNQQISSQSTFGNMHNKPLINGHELSNSNNRSSDLQIVWHGTQKEFDSIQTYNDNCVYIIQQQKKEPVIVGIRPLYEDYQLKVDPDLETDDKSTSGAINQVHDNIGDITELTTPNTNSIVQATNSMQQLIGDMNNLTTTAKDKITNAINETGQHAGKKQDLLTTNKNTRVDAINELVSNVGNKYSLTTIEKNNIVKAINEVETNAGNETTLSTAAKGSLVGAVNEVKTNVGDRTKLTTTSKNSLVSAINENDKQLGVLTSVTTTAKGTFVDSINELYTTSGSSAVSATVSPLTVKITGKSGFTFSNMYATYVSPYNVYVHFDMVVAKSTWSKLDFGHMDCITSMKIDNLQAVRRDSFLRGVSTSGTYRLTFSLGYSNEQGSNNVNGMIRFMVPHTVYHPSYDTSKDVTIRFSGILRIKDVSF